MKRSLLGKICLSAVTIGVLNAAATVDLSKPWYDQVIDSNTNVKLSSLDIGKGITAMEALLGNLSSDTDKSETLVGKFIKASGETTKVKITYDKSKLKVEDAELKNAKDAELAGSGILKDIAVIDSKLEVLDAAERIYNALSATNKKVVGGSYKTVTADEAKALEEPLLDLGKSDLYDSNGKLDTAKVATALSGLFDSDAKLEKYKANMADASADLATLKAMSVNAIADVNSLISKLTGDDKKDAQKAYDTIFLILDEIEAYEDAKDNLAAASVKASKEIIKDLDKKFTAEGYTTLSVSNVLTVKDAKDELKSAITSVIDGKINKDADSTESLDGTNKLSIKQAITYVGTAGKNLKDETNYIGENKTFKDKAALKKCLEDIQASIKSGTKINAKTEEITAILELFKSSKAGDSIALNQNDVDNYNKAIEEFEKVTFSNLAKIEAELKEVLINNLSKSFAAQEKIQKAKTSLGGLSVNDKVLKEFSLNLINNDGSDKDLDMKTIIKNATKEGATAADKKLLSDLKAAANKVAAAIVENEKDEIAAQALGALNIQINNMNKRLGEVRGLDGEIGAWIRANGGRYSTDDQKYNFYSTQIGADKMLSNNDGDLIVGALFGYDYSKGDAKTKTYSVGVYGSFIDNSGAFADVVLKYAQAKHSQDNWDYKKQNMFLASFEGGYRFDIDDSSYFEPSLEFITGYVGKFKANTGSSEITVDSFMPLVLKPQVYFGKSVDDFTFRIGVGGVFNFKKNEADININDLGIDGLNAYASTKLDRNSHGFASIGGAYKFNENLRFNLAVERSFGGNLTKDYEINATLRYTF